MIHRKPIILTVLAVLFLIIYSTPSLVASQDDVNQPQSINANHLALISAIDV